MMRRTHRRARYELEPDPPRHGLGTRRWVVLLGVVLTGALGVGIATRLSSDAIAVLLGVLAGVGASIPCALLLLAVTRRREYPAKHLGSDRDGPYSHTVDPRRALPPVIVITPNHAASQQLAPWAGSQAGWAPPANQDAPPHSQRPFRVMGYDGTEEEG